MEQQKAVQRAIDYIEEHLTEPMSNADLARVAGYSDYHFLRVFKQIVQLTPADYIRKRRISEIVRRLMTEECPIADLAFEYGFQSKENFCRAFKREHHILPTDFRAAQNSLKLYGKLELAQPEMHLQPQIIPLEAFRIVAFASDEPSPPHFWNKYNAQGLSARLTGGRVVEDYGVSLWNARQNRLVYAIGVKESEAVGDVSGTIVLPVPRGLYAVFETPPASAFDFVTQIHRTWDYIGRVWLPQSGYERVPGPEFETYVEQSRTFREKISIPVKPREEQP